MKAISKFRQGSNFVSYSLATSEDAETVHFLGARQVSGIPRWTINSSVILSLRSSASGLLPGTAWEVPASTFTAS